MIFQLFKWHFDINWYKFEKRWADVFQIYPKAIHFNSPQFCPSFRPYEKLLSFPVFCLSSSIVFSHYFAISVNSMSTWSMLKLPKIAWPSPFNCSTCNIWFYYPISLCRVQITPKTSTNITRYLYSKGPVRQIFSQRASNEFDSSYEKKFCLLIGISFLRFFLTEIWKWKTWIDL